MRNIVTLGMALGFSGLMTACASTARPYNHIDAEARPHIQEMDSVLITKHDKLRSNINTSKVSTYLQGHFAPILFDMAVNGMRSYKAGKIMKPIHETVGEYDMMGNVHEEFSQALTDSQIFDMNEMMHMDQEQPGFRGAYIQKSEADAVMFIDVDYAFTPKFDALQLSSRVMVFPVDEALSPYKEKPDTDNIIEMDDNIYRNQFVARIPSPADPRSKKSEHGAAWATLTEDQMTAVMQQAAQQLSAQYAVDLAADDTWGLSVDEYYDRLDDAPQDTIEDIEENTVSDIRQASAEPASGETQSVVTVADLN